MAISGYDINSEIYRGPVTTVYDAFHKSLSRRVLLKVLNTQWRKEKDLIERFQREAKICARMDHPNIVKIFDFNQSEDSFFISMEFIEGSTLDDLIKDQQAIEFSTILNITIQILHGLSFAHQQGIIHRDIKPSNIMISTEGSVRITDFGLAIVSDLPSITDQGQTVGSPAFMSPEQVTGKALDHRSDLFSLGVCLYKLCTQKSPFESETIGETIHNILTKDIDSLTTQNPDIPIWYSEMVDLLLAKDPEERTDSVDAMQSIIQSNFDSQESNGGFEPEMKIDTGKAQQVNLPEVRKSNSGFQARIFLWIFPVILILSYLIFSQSSEDSSGFMAEKNTRGDVQSNLIAEISSKNIVDNEPSPKKTETEKHDEVVQVSEALPKDLPNNLNPDTDVTSPQKGRLFIVAKPWAEIFIDGTYYDQTPLSKSIELNPGKHLVELKNSSYQTFSEYYEFGPAHSETLFVEMQMNIGFLNIKVLPWAKIYVDGNYAETSPIDNPIALAAGEHIITLTNPNFTSIKDTITVQAGKTLEKKFTFKH
jgi:serine/threonine-protein kinase